MKKKACVNCKYFRDGDTYGLCFYNPPKVIYAPTDSEYLLDFATVRPEVNYDDFCSKFEVK